MCIFSLKWVENDRLITSMTTSPSGSNKMIDHSNPCNITVMYMVFYVMACGEWNFGDVINLSGDLRIILQRNTLTAAILISLHVLSAHGVRPDNSWSLQNCLEVFLPCLPHLCMFALVMFRFHQGNFPVWYIVIQQLQCEFKLGARSTIDIKYW